MTIDPAETRAWAERHRAAWELTPLQEMCRGQRMQVGFDLELFARMPTELPPGAEQDAAVVAIWDRLREIAESLVPEEPAGDRLEVGAFDVAGRLRPETSFEPEILLSARIVHAADYVEPVSADDRGHVRPVEERLRELGLRHRSW